MYNVPGIAHAPILCVSIAQTETPLNINDGVDDSQGHTSKHSHEHYYMYTNNPTDL